MTRVRSSPLLLVLGGAGVLAVAAIAFLALRGGDEALGANPARVTPPRVALYADVFLRPPGEQGANARKLVARAVGARDGGARVATLVARAVEGGRGDLDYARDVEPWIGARVGLFYRALAGPRSRGTLVIAAKDPGRARTALVTSPGAGARRAYRGIDYALRPDGTAAGVVDGFAVVGDDAGVRASIDAARGYALAATDRFRLRVRRAKEDRVGFVYIDLLSLGDLLGPGLVQAATAKQLRQRLSVTDPLPVVAILSAKPSAALADFGPRPGDAFPPGQQAPGNAGGGQGDGGTPPGEAGGGAAPAPGTGDSEDVAGPEAGPGSGASPGTPTAGLSLLSAPLLPELPADAWLALGVPDAGRQASDLVDPAIDPGLGLDAIDDVERRLDRDGLELRDDVLPALGGMVLFLRGGSPGRLDGGAVIESLDPGGSRAALGRLVRVLAQRPGWRARASGLGGQDGEPPRGFRVDAPGIAAPVYMTARGNRIVVGVGRRAAVAALDAPRKLGDSPGFRAASATLAPSLRPDSFLDLPRALRVLDATSVSRAGAYRVARPILDAFSFVAFAAKNRIRRFALGTR